MTILQVGRSIVRFTPKKAVHPSTRCMQYGDVPYDVEGWADASKYLPLDCDLVVLLTEDEKVRKGWRTGCFWEGLRLKDTEKVIKWKRVLHDY